MQDYQKDRLKTPDHDKCAIPAVKSETLACNYSQQCTKKSKRYSISFEKTETSVFCYNILILFTTNAENSLLRCSISSEKLRKIKRMHFLHSENA